MKKHLIAAAVASAFVMPAMAQNVTISGYLESAYESVNHNTAASKVDSFVGAGFWGSPRLAISGSEDLGGGLKAGFRLESTVNAVTGQFGSATLGAQATTGPVFDRGAEVSLSGPFGTFAFGKLDHRGIEDNDINVVGNVALFNSNVVEAGAVASDVNGTIRYTTPEINGLTFEIAHTPADNGNSNALASSKGHSGITSYQARGTIGGVSFRVGAGTVGNAQTGANASAAGDTDNLGFGFSYDFGAAAVSIAYQRQTNPGATADAKSTVLGVKVPLGNGLDGRFHWETDDLDGVNALDSRTGTLALVKTLSKRSSVSVYYQDQAFDAPATALTSDNSRIGVRIAHSF